VHFPEDGRLSILNAASPVSARRTRLLVPIVRNYKDVSLEDVHKFDRQVFEEDRAIVEQQRLEELPIDRLPDGYRLSVAEGETIDTKNTRPARRPGAEKPLSYARFPGASNRNLRSCRLRHTRQEHAQSLP
jgi:hypothetical protein